jgi:hypothetical protein
MKQDNWIDCNMNLKHKAMLASSSELLKDNSLIYNYFYNLIQELIFTTQVLEKKKE